MVIYEIKDLSFTYPGEEHAAVENINVKINSGDFVLLCGCSGSGKSTLISQMKKEILPKGKKTGSVCFYGADIEKVKDFESVSKIGYCAQNPELQQICETVEGELQFVLENLGFETDKINIKLAETVSFFGIENLLHKKISELSGGERQIINIAAALVTEPQVLLLDEPFSQLDTFSSERLAFLLKKLNDELGITVIAAEHNFEKILEYCNAVIYLNDKQAHEFSLKEFIKSGCLKEFSLIPYEIYNSLLKQQNEKIPVSVSECKKILSNFDVLFNNPNKCNESEENICDLKKVFFKYKKNSPDVLSDVNLSVNRGEVLSVIGCNGSGKTTLISLINGVYKPYSGKIRLKESIKTAVMPQNPTFLFSFDTVVQVLNNCNRTLGYKDLFKEMNNMHPETSVKPNEEVKAIAQKLKIVDALYKNPYDLSVGQQQITAFAYILLKRPDLVILDEPTKGIDKLRKDMLIEFISEMKKDGKTVIIVTHDMDFAAEVSDRCALLFDGKIVTEEKTADFLKSSRNYTSTVNQIFSDINKENRPVSLKEVKRCSAKQKQI